MRKLTTAQKSLLDKAGATTYYELSMEEIEALEKINDYETLWQDANRYLIDKHFDKLYGGK